MPGKADHANDQNHCKNDQTTNGQNLPAWSTAQMAPFRSFSRYLVALFRNAPVKNKQTNIDF